MAWLDFEEQLKNARFDFSEEQLKNLKIACTDLYSILKFVFDSPRKLATVEKPYKSYTEAKFKRERMYQSPSDFFNFRHDDVVISVSCRRKKFYSLVIVGFDYDKITKTPYDRYEKTYAKGVTYYGLWSRTQFWTCVSVWRQCVYDFLKHRFDYVSLFED